MKLTFQRGARWVPLKVPRIVPTLWEGTNHRPAAADHLVTRMRQRAWEATRGT